MSEVVLEHTCVRCGCLRPEQYMLPDRPMQQPVPGGVYVPQPGTLWQCAIQYACDTQHKFRLAGLLEEHGIQLTRWELETWSLAGLQGRHRALHATEAEHPYAD